MNYLSVENISKSFNERVLFENISFGINEGQKVALVGNNGSGKSTLLKVIFGSEEPDSGEVVFRNDIKVRFLSQNPEFPFAKSVKEAVFDQDDEVMVLLSNYESALLHNDVEQINVLVPEIDAKNAWDYEKQIEQILGKLGIHNLDQDINELSGGQRKKVALAKVLVEKPDLLILDEPTNHLDLEIIEWLEEYLETSKMALLLVTHDRYFLENVTDEIIELDQKQLFSYKGNYSYFLEKKAERMEIKAREVGKARQLMVKELDWIRRQPKARGTKAKYRIDAFDALKNKASQHIREEKVDIKLGSTRLGKKIMEITHLNKRFDELDIAKDFNYTFKKGDKIGIIGKNGTGKTSFLNLLTGNDKNFQGHIVAGETVKIGYYKQEETAFNNSDRLIDVVKSVAEVVKLEDGSQVGVAQFLEQFLFSSDKQYTPVEKLSGGEKKRLQLILVLLDSPNFLVLDEPTNDLDIYTLNVLEEYLIRFPGVLVVVSHDRFFIDRLANHCFVFRGKGKIEDFPGNYSQFRSKEQLAIEEKRQTATTKTEKEPVAVKQKTTSRKLSFKERRELDELTQQIEQLENRKSSLVDQMNRGIANHEELAEIGKELQVLEEELDEKSMRWFELSEFEN